MEENRTLDLGPFFTNEHGDQYLYSVNRSSFARMAAEEVYRDFFGEDLFQEDSLYLVVGTDSGLLVKHLISSGIPEGSRFLFLEPEEVYKRLPEVLDLEMLPPEIGIATRHTFGEILGRFHGRDYVSAGRAYAQRTLCSLDAHFPEYVELHAEMKAAMEEARWATLNSLGNHGFVQRQLENLAGNQTEADCLKGLFPGKTAVVLGVGPSLDEILPWVKENRERLVIIAVTRAAKRLLEAGITPHILVSIDPSIHSFDVSRDMLSFAADSIFVHAYHVSSPLLGLWSGRSLYVGRRLPWASPYNRETIALNGPTVTQLAITLAIEMGFAQIVLGGVDLCFSKEGNIYGKGTQGRELGVRLGDVRGGVETNGGWRAETIIAFLHGAKVTDTLAGYARSQGCRVINMAIGAVKLSHVDYLPVAEIELEDFDVPIVEALNQTLPTDSEDAFLEHCRAMYEEMLRAEKAFNKIEALACKALQANAELFGKGGGGKSKKQMDRIEQQLNTTYKDFAYFAKRFGVLKFLKINRPGREGWENQEQVLETGRLYYEAYRDTASELIGLVQRGKEVLLLRLEEFVERPDFDLLLQGWEKYYLFGRGAALLQGRPELKSLLTGEQCQVLDDLTDRFQKIITRQENMGANAVAKKDYSRLKAQAQTLFKSRERDSLAVVAAGLTTDESPKGKNLSLLAQGYLAELDAEVDTALQCYETLIDEQSELVLEESLKRVAAISFERNDQENLLLAIECLAGISPLYIPKFADLLWVSGDVDRALDVYADYFGRCPNDLLSMLKLGSYYLELGSDEGARMTLGYVLERDPENRTAQRLLADMEA